MEGDVSAGFPDDLLAYDGRGDLRSGCRWVNGERQQHSPLAALVG